MSVNPDFRDLFSEFNGEKVDYLVVGAHAVIFHSRPRFTKDLDVWVRPTPENAARVFRALAEFGAPMIDVTPESFTEPDLVYQIGVAPNRIDILMDISGVSFGEAWDSRVESTYGGVGIHIIGKEELLRAKRAAARPQDLLDVESLL